MKKAVTIGTFDGLHRGHCLVIDTLKKEASRRGLQPFAISFSSHPLELIAPERAPGNLLTKDRKSRLISSRGVSPIILPFNEQLRRMTAFEWMDYLYRKYDVRLIVAGYDNTFGSDGIDMTIADYKAMGDTIGIEVVSAPEAPGVSSSRIRKAVKAGNIAAATELLGHYPENEGKVAPGFHVGSKIGFPTANLQLPSQSVVPPAGVYAAYAYIDEAPEAWPAMVNIGTRPTFEGSGFESSERSVEAHIIGFENDLYGHVIRLEYAARLRDEEKFPSIEALTSQLEKDRLRALEILLPQEK